MRNRGRWGEQDLPGQRLNACNEIALISSVRSIVFNKILSNIIIKRRYQMYINGNWRRVAAC